MQSISTKLKRIKQRLNQSSILWSLLFNGLRMGAGILVLPIALRTIPEAEMGIYYTFMSLSGLAMLLDFGMVGTIGRSAAYAWGGASSFKARGLPEHHGRNEPNKQLLATLSHVTRIWYYILAVIVALLLSGVGSLFINKRIVESGLDHSMIYCWLFFSMITAYSIGTSFWTVLLTGIGDVTTVGKFGVLSQIISTTILAIGLLLGLKVWAYALSLFIGPAIARTLARRRYIILLKHPLPLLMSRPDFGVITNLWPMTWRMGVTILGIYLMQRGNILISSAFLGLETTAKYGLTLNLFSIILQISGVALYVANPRIASALVQRDIHLVRRLFLPRLYGGLTLAVLGATTLIVFGSQILNLIGSQTGLISSGLACILFAIMFLDNHQNAYANLVMSSNENPFVLPVILSSVAMVGTALWTTPYYGLAGLIFTHGIVQLAWSQWWPVLLGTRLLRRDMSKTIAIPESSSLTPPCNPEA